MKRLLTIVLALFFPLSAFAAPTFLNVGHTPFGASPQTLSFDAGTADNRILIACVGTLNNTSTAPTFNGVAFTDSGAFTTYPGVGRFGMRVWYLLAPASGSHTFSSGSSAGSVETFVLAYSGVNQATPIDVTGATTNDGNNFITSTLTTTIADDLMAMCEIDSGSGAGPSFTAGANTTLRDSDVTLAGSTADSGTGRAIGSNSTTINALGAIPPTFIAAVAFALRPVLDNPSRLIRSGGSVIRGTSVQVK